MSDLTRTDTRTGDAPPAFTPQEEHFLRAYSESLVRFEAMQQAGYVSEPLDVAGHQAIMRQAGELLERAEHLPWKDLALAMGADRLYFLSRLKVVCDSPVGHIAIKGLVLLARIHGLFDKADTKAPQVALVFNQAHQPAPGARTTSLPFTMPAGSYELFPEPESGPRTVSRDLAPPENTQERAS